METCTSLLLKTDPQEQEQEQALKKVEQLLAEGFEVIKMWSDKTLLDKFPCYLTDEIEKELKVDWKNVFFLSLMTTYDTFNLEGKTSIRQWPSLVESEMSIYFKICNYICNKEIVIVLALITENGATPCLVSAQLSSIVLRPSLYLLKHKWCSDAQNGCAW